jgi:hypothetical protein
MAKPERLARTRPDDFTSDPDIKLLHDQFDYATDAWADIVDEGQVDMRCIGGDTWEPSDRQMREAAARPCLSLDEFGQYVNQIINDVRQNKRAIKVTPLGNGANDQSAALRADLFRQIEYRSNAQQAYTTMFENAVQRSYGYLRVKPRYVSDRSRHQELIIEPIMNPDLVTPDPDAIKPDLSDIKYLFLAESWSKPEFQKAFPKARVQDFTTDMMRQAPRWVKDERIMLAEWWSLRQAQKKLVYIDVAGQPGQPAKELDVFEEDAPKILARFRGAARIVGDRMADVPEVRMRLTNGIEILKETPWKGQYIPFVGCFGKILYLNDGTGPTKRILSAIRLAIPAAQLFNYSRTGEAEQLGMATRFPYFVRDGSLSPEEARKLEQSTHEPVGFITIKGIGDNMPPGVLPEMPVRNSFEPAIQALEILAEGARRSIQAGMGISPLPTSAQRRNEKSGVALKQIEESAQKGTYHFVDHFEMSVTRVGVIIDDLLPHYYDAARELTVRKPDDTPVQVRVNDPNQPAQGKAAEPYGETPMIATGDHDITLSTGPSYDSEREAANDFSDTLVGAIDRIAPLIGPERAAKLIALSIKLKNIGPLGNEMAEIISPPEEEGGPQIPPEVQAQMQQMQAQIQELQQLADDNLARVTIAKGKDQTTLQATEMKLVAEASKTRQDNETKLAVAELGAKVDRLMLFLEERARLGVQAHEVGSAVMAHEQQKELAGLAHQQALEAGDVAHGQALEAGAQPPPIDPNALIVSPEPEGTV